jgi:excisionase family DNA binding protein
LTVIEAATRLAIRPATVRKMLYLRRIPRVKIGRGVRIKEEDLEALIRHGYQPARCEDRR